MEILIYFLCISQIFIYLIFIYLYGEFQELKGTVAFLNYELDLLYGGKENESKNEEK